MKRIYQTLIVFMIILLTACGSHSEKTDKKIEDSNFEKLEKKEKLKKVEKAEEVVPLKMNIMINNTLISATLENNVASEAFIKMIKEKPLTIEMREYSGFEKIGSLNTTLPSEDSLVNTQSGDIVLYNGSNIVIFYGTNTWQYTKLGKIDDVKQWLNLIEEGSMILTFSMANE